MATLPGIWNAICVWAMPQTDLRIFGAPRQYIQGPGATQRMASIASGKNCVPLIIADEEVMALHGDSLLASFEHAPAVLSCSGEASLETIEALAQAARDIRNEAVPMLVYGVGGGKALDVAKGVAIRLAAQFVAVPTIASNDSATGRAVAVYDNNHKLVAIEHLAQSPEAVIVDTAIISQAPVRFLRAGIGDAISKKFEAERAHRDGGINFFGTPATLSALALADCCYLTLLEHAAIAVSDAERNMVSDSFEATIEACLLMSGIAWESGGVSLAHAIVRGIARLPNASGTLHGEHVAYGLLVQMAAQQADDMAFGEMICFFRSVGLPTCLRDLQITETGHSVFRQIADWAHEGPTGGNLIVSAPADELADAIARVENLAERSVGERSQLR